jgi:hypothetical protein
MKSRVALAVVSIVGSLVACLTVYNRPKITPRPEAPPLERRAEGCHVEILDGAWDKPHLDFADIALDWPRSKIAEQGPEGAMATLRLAACESGAFAIHDMRALVLGTVDQGMVYEGVLATMLDDQGKPLNLKVDKKPDAGTATDATTPPAPLAP